MKKTQPLTRHEARTLDRSRRKQDQKRIADATAQARHTLPDARTYFNTVQLVKAENLRRAAAMVAEDTRTA